MASLTSTCCHVCGINIEDANINAKTKCSVIFHHDPTKNVKGGKNKKGKIKLQNIDKKEDIPYDNITEGTPKVRSTCW